MIILAIESSCDETAMAIVENGRKIISNTVYTQIAIHTMYGGVVPEVASRLHLENITMVIDECINKANMKLEDINPDDVDEISSIKIDRRKSSNERILDFLTQVKNPYVFNVNWKLVRMTFAENGPTADDCLTRVLENL